MIRNEWRITWLSHALTIQISAINQDSSTDLIASALTPQLPNRGQRSFHYTQALLALHFDNDIERIR